MSDIRYINTQDIRKDLVGFLKSLESGQEVAVLNRSKVIARLNRQRSAQKPKAVVSILKAADHIQATADADHQGLAPSESYKDRYYQDMADKYGLSGR